MADPTIPVLGKGTSNRKWRAFQIVGETPGDETFIGGITNAKVSVGKSRQDISEMNDEGWKYQLSTGLDMEVELKVTRRLNKATGQYDDGQEIARSLRLAIDGEDELVLRWFEMNPKGPRVEAFEGTFLVEYNEDGGGVDAASNATIKFASQGPVEIITHPYPLTTTT